MKPFEPTEEQLGLLDELREMLSYQDLLVALDRAQEASAEGRDAVTEYLKKRVQERADELAEPPSEGGAGE